MTSPQKSGSADQTCPEKVYRGDTWNPSLEPCGKKAKRDGLCGTHANAKDRLDQKLARRDRIRATTDDSRVLAEELADAGYLVSWDAAGVHFSHDEARKLLTALRGDPS